VLGFLLLGIGFRLPQTFKISLDLLGSGASGLALFAMGLFLARTPLRGFKVKPAIISTMLKLVVAPFIALLLGRLFGLEGIALAVTVIMAALPSAIFCMVVATEYDFDERATADTILLSSVMFIFTSSIWVSLVY
jgi:predicted permease